MGRTAFKDFEWVSTRIWSSPASKKRSESSWAATGVTFRMSRAHHNDELPGLTDSILILIQYLHIDTDTHMHTINNYKEEGHIGIRVC